MALLLKTTTVADEASHNIQRTNTTEAYDSVTNPTGYGANQIPIPYRDYSSIQYGELYIFPLTGTVQATGEASLTTSENLYYEMLDSTQAQSFANGAELIYNLATLIGDVYVDGVYFANYVEWYDGITSVQGASVGNIISIIDYNEFTNAKYISIENEDTTYSVYEIIKVNTNNTIQINKEITILGGELYRVGYETVNYFTNVFDINKCLHSHIAKLACSECKCNDKKKETLYTAVMQFFGIETNMDRGNYKCAQELIDAITIYCSKNGCGC